MSLGSIHAVVAFVDDVTVLATTPEDIEVLRDALCCMNERRGW
jgi:hypothetical protein